MKKISILLWPFTLLWGCKQEPFALEPPDYSNLIHVESGLYVHREVELRVDPARFETPPTNAAPGAVSSLDACQFFPLGTSSTWFAPSKNEEFEDELFWREVTHLSKADFKGRTSRGLSVRWEKDGAVTVADVMEIFEFPPPEISQIDHWTPWFKASRSRAGIFAWHAEANKHAEEIVPPPAYPFQMRFRLVLSERMYP